jgi:hypothetical protein
MGSGRRGLPLPSLPPAGLPLPCVRRKGGQGEGAWPDVA